MALPPFEPIADESVLERLYEKPVARSIYKEVPRLTPSYRAFIEASPFFLLATAGPEGLDCSPRGDAPGFVRVHDDATLLVPDRRGNNRIDSLRNIVRDGRVGLLFMIPGCDETLRVNGRAAITADRAICRSFAVGDKIPQTTLVISIETVYFQCARALVRSHLWDPQRHVSRSSLPSAGRMLDEASGTCGDGEDYDRMLPDRLRTTLY